MKDLLKFLTCGSVDDGKSTLIGRMLYDAKLLYADHTKALESDSRLGSRDGNIDYSLLLDGLIAEREQGITIDVAYRFFTTEKRSFIVADCPGHEQYTRNMAVGASFADLAIILADASKGLLTQTRRHARICAMMGIRHFLLAVNKFDLVHFDIHVFNKIADEFQELMGELGVQSVHSIPVCATDGDNITKPSKRTLWYDGLPLLPYLEQVNTASNETASNGFAMPVQRVCRPNRDFRGFQGQVEDGVIKAGDEITVLPANERARVETIYTADCPSVSAAAGQPVTIKLDKEIDVSRGDVLVSNSEPEVGNAIIASLLWLDDEELIPGRSYRLKCAAKMLPATVVAVKYRINVNSGKHIAAKTLRKNELAVCDISLSEAMVYDSFVKSKALGSFILIDRVTNMTSACGTIKHSLRRSDNVKWRDTDITPGMRADIKRQKPLTLWFTGLSGAGKTVLANALEKRLHAEGMHTMLLDGDNMRHGLNRNLGFEEHDRVENIRRTAEVAKLMNDAGLIVLSSFISPYDRDRENAREIIGEPFKLVHVSTPLEVCERRDEKGLYAKARRGEILNFTGINAVYETPSEPELEINTDECSIEEAVESLMSRFFPNYLLTGEENN